MCVFTHIFTHLVHVEPGTHNFLYMRPLVPERGCKMKQLAREAGGEWGLTKPRGSLVYICSSPAGSVLGGITSNTGLFGYYQGWAHLLQFPSGVVGTISHLGHSGPRRVVCHPPSPPPTQMPHPMFCPHN